MHEPIWSRYLFVRILSIQPSSGQGELHFYCTLTSFKAFGRTVIQDAADVEPKHEIPPFEPMESIIEDPFPDEPEAESTASPFFIFPFTPYSIASSDDRNLNKSSIFNPFISSPNLYVSRLTPFNNKNYVADGQTLINSNVDAILDEAELALKDLQNNLEIIKTEFVKPSLKNSKSQSVATANFHKDFLAFIRNIRNRDGSGSQGSAQVSVLKRLAERVKNLEIGSASMLFIL